MGKSIASRFENIDIEKSKLLGVIINDDELSLEMDFCLEPGHPDYEKPWEEGEACFHPGMLKFAGITKLDLERAKTAHDGADGMQRRFAIETFSIDGTRFAMTCEWGRIDLSARSIRVLTD